MCYKTNTDEALDLGGREDRLPEKETLKKIKQHRHLLRYLHIHTYMHMQCILIV